MLRIALGLGLFLSAAVPAQAQFATGADLQRQCSIEAQYPVCIGYIQGVTDTFASVSQGEVCILQGMQLEEIVAAVLVRMQNNPADLGSAASYSVMSALADAFPARPRKHRDWLIGHGYLENPPEREDAN